MSSLETEEILKERIIIYQHDLICCYESGLDDKERIKQDKAIIDELKRIWYKNGLDSIGYED